MLKYLELLLFKITHAWNWLRRWFSPGGVQGADMTEIVAGLWLGGFPTVLRPNMAVMNMAEEDIDPVPLGDFYVWVREPDLPPAPTPETLQWLVDTIAAWLRMGRVVLCHCDEGNHRSATVVCAFIMASMGLSAERALAFVQSKRVTAIPHSWQRAALQRYEEFLKSGSP